jgi:hypothetical protein
MNCLRNKRSENEEKILKMENGKWKMENGKWKRALDNF